MTISCWLTSCLILQIDIDGHDYEYPLAPEQGKVQPEQGAYLELQPLAEEQKGNVQLVPKVYQELQPAGPEQHGTQSLYQPLSAEEENKHKVVVEPEENISVSWEFFASQVCVSNVCHILT